MSDPLIAVTGATGAVGGRVAARLAEAGAAQRLIVRDAARAPRHAGAEVREVPGYHAGDAMRAALEGAHTLFLVPAEEEADRVARHVTAVEAAVAAGVERLVYLSFLGAAPDATFLLARDHWATEERIRLTDLRWAFVRMSLYIDFVPRLVRPDGIVAGPGGDGRAGVVARDDVADVASAVLLGGHDGETLDVTGREALSLAEMAAVLAREGGRPIAYREETLEEARASRAGSGAPGWLVEAWISTYTAIAAGELATVTDTVARLAGHEPQTLTEYVRANPDCLGHVEARSR
jgi:uncharacterized protein YbjT (DUF2867 family)